MLHTIALKEDIATKADPVKLRSRLMFSKKSTRNFEMLFCRDYTA